MSFNVYALTDSHQESRNLSILLSGIYSQEKNLRTPFVVLDAGDLFKGIYDKHLSVNSYINFKKLMPQSNIIITLGNNDFGFDEQSLEYLKFTIAEFKKFDINFVCTNLKDCKTKEYSNLVPRYKILNIANRRILVMGFCLNTSIMKKFALEFIDAKTAFFDLLENIKEDFDSIFILNHHWYPYSRDLYDFITAKGVNIGLIIGGHEHSPIEADTKRNIYYPLSFARSLYKISFANSVESAAEYGLDKYSIIPELDKEITAYENKAGLFNVVAKRVLNLEKKYSEPCALGTFISDNMKRIGQTDIAFHSTGFTMYSLSTNDSDVITKYDFEKVICAPTPIVKVKLNTEELKTIFENATLKRMYKNNGNSRFLQCSGNICITGKGNPIDKTYKIIQIEINGVKLLDKNQNPIDKKQEYTCTIDEFISKGEQGFDILKTIPKSKVLCNGREVKINELLLESLQSAQNIYKPCSEYPSFKIIDL